MAYLPAIAFPQSKRLSPTRSASPPLTAKTLVPVEIKATSYGFPPTGLLGKYNKTPKKGSVDNLISVWPSEEITLYVELPEPFKTNPPPGLITWDAPGHNVPPNSTEYKFKWTDTGTKTVTITVGTSKFKVVVDVPNVGNNSEKDVLLAMNPVTRLQILNYGKQAEDYANGNFPATPIRDATRHSYWNALCISDSWIPSSAIEGFATAHEWDNKWGYKLSWSVSLDVVTLINVAPQSAFDSTMDLHNNEIGRATAHTIPDGAGGYGPDSAAILSDLASKYKVGVMYIWDGGADEDHSQGILLKSNSQKIYQ